MSQAGTPSSDPWVILSKERLRYEELFKALKPINGIVTGEQAKGFLLQSQLPPLVLGQIWALADTDADGKMDISEFSIACKLINLKLRGMEVPKVLPPVLLASLKSQTPPAIPPLPNASLINPPPRPEPPKVAPITSQPTSQTNTPLIPNLTGHGAPLTNTIPTGIVPPMQSASQVIAPLQTSMPPMQPVQPLISGIPSLNTQPLVNIAPISAVAPQTTGTIPPLIPDVQSAVPSTIGASFVATSVSQTLVSSTSAVPPSAPIIPGMPPISSAGIPSAVVPVPHMSPAGSTSSVGPGATSTPRASITSLEKTNSIDSR